MITEEDFDIDLPKFIRDTARRESTDVIDPEDLEQELWLYMLERDDIKSPGQMIEILKLQAKEIAHNERIDYMHFRGAFIYTPAMVRGLLGDAVWCEVEDSFDVEGRVDVTRAVKQLPYKDQRKLFYWFGCNERSNDSTTKSAISRLVDKIANALNFGAELEQADETFVIDPSTVGGDTSF